MEGEQYQYDIDIDIEQEQNLEDEGIDLKKLMFYSYLMQITENNNGTKACTFCEYLLLIFVYSVNDTMTNSVTEVINIKFYEGVFTMWGDL